MTPEELHAVSYIATALNDPRVFPAWLHEHVAVDVRVKITDSNGDTVGIIYNLPHYEDGRHRPSFEFQAIDPNA